MLFFEQVIQRVRHLKDVWYLMNNKLNLKELKLNEIQIEHDHELKKVKELLELAQCDRVIALSNLDKEHKKFEEPGLNLIVIRNQIDKLEVERDSLRK